MKDFYKRLGIDRSASSQLIRDAISSNRVNADAAAIEAAEFVLLDGKRRTAYDCTHRVLTTVGDLRSHLGLNYKPFWSRGKLQDFTYELAGKDAPGRQRTIRSLRQQDIRRAFGLRSRDPFADYEASRRHRLIVACLLVAIAALAVGALAYFALRR